jgi:hypothetical protein
MTACAEHLIVIALYDLACVYGQGVLEAQGKGFNAFIAVILQYPPAQTMPY